MNRPITPDEVVGQKQEGLPSAVFEAFNELIARQWDGNSATIDQSYVADLIAYKMNVSRHTVFAKHFLDVDDVYRKAGWHVEYDKPGFNESYPAYFVFTKKRKR